MGSLCTTYIYFLFREWEASCSRTDWLYWWIEAAAWRFGYRWHKHHFWVSFFHLMIIYSLYINIITKSSSYPSISYNFCYHCFQGKKCDHLWHRIQAWSCCISWSWTRLWTSCCQNLGPFLKLLCYNLEKFYFILRNLPR